MIVYVETCLNYVLVGGMVCERHYCCYLILTASYVSLIPIRINASICTLQLTN